MYIHLYIYVYMYISMLSSPATANAELNAQHKSCCVGHCRQADCPSPLLPSPSA